ncbi:MAG: nickel pincer cofactor biosynthesis protein LarB [Pseudomonadota bacterium]
MSFTLDWDRAARTGTPEAVFCEGKRVGDIDAILAHAGDRSLLLTRLTPQVHAALAPAGRDRLDYDTLSHTAILGRPGEARGGRVAIVAAGTSDLSVAHEAARALTFFGHTNQVIADVGVAGLWRLQARLEEIETYDVVIVAAGMEGALFSVLAGLIANPIIALPTPNGYGVSEGGKAALSTALASCAPGLMVVNIGNGFGAACAAARILRLAAARTVR